MLKTRLFLPLVLSGILVAMVCVSRPAGQETGPVDSTQTDPVLLKEIGGIGIRDDSINTFSPTIIDTNIIVPVIEFRGTPLREALDALSRPYGIDMWIDPGITGLLTLRLTDVDLNDAILFVIDNNHLAFERKHGVITIFPRAAEPPPPVQVTYADRKLTVIADRTDLTEFAKALTEQSDFNILVESGIAGSISGHLDNAEFESGLRALLESNGFALEEWEGIYRITQPVEDVASRSGTRSRSTARCVDGKVSLAVANADLHALIENVASSCGLQLFIYGSIEGQVSAVCSGLDPETVFAYLLNGTPYTYKVEDGIYFVGDKKIDEINTSELLVFNHVVGKDLIDVIPQRLSQLVTVKSAIEQNGLMISGPYGAVREVVRYLRLLDVPPAQVLIEAIVVDYSISESSEFGIRAGLLGAGDSLIGRERYYPDVELDRTGDELNAGVQEWASHLGINNIGRLSDDFYIQLRAMEQEGVANIRSRPQIAALNGHKASIHVGTTQYYLLKTETVYSSSQVSPATQVSQRFETIDADISFEVTPWVTSSGEIIVEIKPEFKTPQGTFDPDIPPTINQRVLESTVRLKDGETIVLGGLIQSGKTQNIDKFPILGDIPILGRIFQNRRTVTTKNELVIYLTPHVYYGSEQAVDPEVIEEP